jgi:hypothetical protein
MADIQAENIPGLVAGTLANLDRLKWTDASTDYHDTVVFKRLIKSKKTVFSDGRAINWNLLTDENHSARAVPLAAPDIVVIRDDGTTGTMPWRHQTWNYGEDFRESLMNGGASKIVDIIQARRLMALASAVVFYEQRFWRLAPPTDALNFQGIPYWIVKTATAATLANANGFNGVHPTGYTDVGGISAITYPRTANYADAYTNVTEEDLVTKMRRAMTMTNFKPIVDGIPTSDRGWDRLICTNYAVYGPFENQLRAQNDNLGNDIAARDGEVMFRKNKVEYIQELDQDSTNPVYGIDFGVMFFAGLRGAWLKETVQNKVSGKHTVDVVFTDCTGNTVCKNRRKQWVISNGTTNIGD